MLVIKCRECNFAIKDDDEFKEIIIEPMSIMEVHEMGELAKKLGNRSSIKSYSQAIAAALNAMNSPRACCPQCSSKAQWDGIPI